LFYFKSNHSQSLLPGKIKSYPAPYAQILKTSLLAHDLHQHPLPTLPSCQASIPAKMFGTTPLPPITSQLHTPEDINQSMPQHFSRKYDDEQISSALSKIKAGLHTEKKTTTQHLTPFYL